MSRVVLATALLFAVPALALTQAERQSLRDALIYQAYFGTAEGTKSLLKKGADPDTRDEHDWPVLAVAADRSDKEAYGIAAALINAGADVNAAHERNYPLLNAIRNNNAPLVAALVAADANLRIKSPDGIYVYSLAKKHPNKQILYYIEKQLFEEAQTQTYLKSSLHLNQIAQQYAFHHCAFQYWGYYLRSKQDADMDEEAIKDRMRQHAAAASEIGKRALRYFPDVYHEKFQNVAATERSYITNLLNEMISNRNRKLQGIGKVDDMLKRCHIDKTPAYFQAIAVNY